MITMMIEQQKDPVVREEYEEYAYLYPYVKKAFEVIVDLMQARMTPSVMRNPFMIVPAVPDHIKHCLRPCLLRRARFCSRRAWLSRHE